MWGNSKYKECMHTTAEHEKAHSGKLSHIQNGCSLSQILKNLFFVSNFFSFFFTFHSVSFLQALYLYLSFNFTSLVFILQSHFTSLVFILQSHFTSLVFILQSHFYKPCVYTSVSLLQALCLYFSDLRREHEELWDIVYTSRNRM